jgi:hypothetical protein
MEEFEEEWPVAKESQEEVWTSAVSLEPRTAEVPEIAMQDVEVEVRTRVWVARNVLPACFLPSCYERHRSRCRLQGVCARSMRACHHRACLHSHACMLTELRMLAVIAYTRCHGACFVMRGLTAGAVACRSRARSPRWR